MENNVIIGVHNRTIHYLSGTYEGKKYEKKICDEEQLTFPA
jgi:hypothetical protein